MYYGITCVGLDVHLKQIVVALLRPGTEVAVVWAIDHTPAALRKLAKRLLADSGGEVICCYEAGSCGYTVARTLGRAGLRCLVVAPSLVWQAPGKRVKNDRQDARKLAQQLRSGMLSEVQPPTPEEEGLRDLMRERDAAREQVKRAKQRVTMLTQKYGCRWRRSRWTKAYRRWLGSLRMPSQLAAECLARRVSNLAYWEAQLAQLDRRVHELAADPRYRPVVEALCCLRGVGVLTAMVLVAELYAVGRFASARQLMAFLGLTPGEHSSGESHRKTRITRRGNAFVRRVLIESAQHQRKEVRVTVERQRRREQQPEHVVTLVEEADQRLHQRYWHLRARGKPHQKAAVAVAREQVGFIWELMHTYDTPPRAAVA